MFKTLLDRIAMIVSIVSENYSMLEVQFTIGETNISTLLVATTVDGIREILLSDNSAAATLDLQRRFPSSERNDNDTELNSILSDLIDLVNDPLHVKNLGLDLNLDLRGSPFQIRVWQALRKIPAGTTVSYQEISTRISAPRSARAVAGACAANPIAVVIPCHRVVRSDGTLSGYRWGIARKRALLQREQR